MDNKITHDFYTLLKALPKKATMYLTILNSFFATYQEIGYTNRILQPEQNS